MLLVYGLNYACNKISVSYLKIDDESMSAICYQITSKGDLPHLSYILCKPEPLGAEINTMGFYDTRLFLLLYL